jgi:hypothetical protein
MGSSSKSSLRRSLRSSAAAGVRQSEQHISRSSCSQMQTRMLAHDCPYQVPKILFLHLLPFYHFFALCFATTYVAPAANCYHPTIWLTAMSHSRTSASVLRAPCSGLRRHHLQPDADQRKLGHSLPCAERSIGCPSGQPAAMTILVSCPISKVATILHPLISTIADNRRTNR